MPPDVFAAEAPDAVGRVQYEPEKILDEEKEDIEAGDPQFQAPCPDGGLQRDRRVHHAQHEDLHPEVIAGQGAGAVKDLGPAVIDAPGGQFFGPAMRAFDLDFQAGENHRHGDEIDDEKHDRQRNLRFLSSSARLARARQTNSTTASEIGLTKRIKPKLEPV